MKEYFSVEKAKLALSSPLFKNRYIVFFGTQGSKTVGLFDMDMGLMTNTLSMPTFSINAKQQYIGGINVVIPNMWEQGQLDMTLYNTGWELRQFEQWQGLHYNQATRSYGYVNDICISVKVMEFDRASNVVLTHNFTGCTLYQLGGQQLAYDDATEVQTFNVSLQFRGYKLEA